MKEAELRRELEFQAAEMTRLTQQLRECHERIPGSARKVTVSTHKLAPHKLTMDFGYEDMDVIVKPAERKTPPQPAKPPRNRSIRDAQQQRQQQQQSADVKEDTYNQLGGIGQRPAPQKPTVDDSQETYSQLEQSGRVSSGRLPSVSKAVNPMYSTVQTNEPQVYAVVNKPKRSKPPPQPQQQQEYAEIDKYKPKVPEKSEDLLRELEASEASGGMYS